MPVCMFLVELAITCVHDYTVVTVTVTKIYGKMNFNRWALAITAVPTTLTSRFPTTGTGPRSAVGNRQLVTQECCNS